MDNNPDNSSPVVAPGSTPQLIESIEKLLIDIRFASAEGGSEVDEVRSRYGQFFCLHGNELLGVLRQVAPGTGETPHPPAETTTDEKDTRCVATSGTFRCDREAGHAGHHRLYNEAIDEPMFWGQSLIDRIQDYLGHGGFFNPECIDHVMVRALLLDVRDVLVGETQLAVPHASHPPAEPKLFPIQAERGYTRPFPRQVPWSIAERAYGVYSSQYGSSQTLERLAQRGGFGPSEMDTFYPSWLTDCSELAAATAALTQLREGLHALEARIRPTLYTGKYWADALAALLAASEGKPK